MDDWHTIRRLCQLGTVAVRKQPCLTEHSSFPFDGDLQVQIVPVITGGAGSYVEMCTTYAAQVSINTFTTYTLAFRVSAPVTAGDCYCGVRVWQGGKVQTSVPGPQWPNVSPPVINPVITHIPTGLGWTLVSLPVHHRQQLRSYRRFLRFTSSGTYYVDGAQLIVGQIGGTYGQQLYTRDGTYRANGFNVEAGAITGLLTADAAASITTWGEREASVTNTDVVDDTTGAAFAVGYFDAFAVPTVQARLTLDQPTSPLLLDGAVQVMP